MVIGLQKHPLSFGERLMSRGIWQTAEGLLGLDPLEL
jgi:hypothetical protein